jgi:MFS family permease
MTAARPLYTSRFVLILGLQFVFGLGFSSFFLLPKYLTAVHHADAGWIGRIMAAGPISAVLTMPLLARHIDRLRRHHLLMAAASFMLAASLGFAGLTELGPVVYLLRALQGAAFTVYMATSAALVVETCPPQRLGQALGLLGAANLATNAIGPGIAEPLALAQGWRAVFLLSATCSTLAALGVVALREPPRIRVARREAPRLQEPRRLALLYVSMVVGIAFGTIVTFYQPLALSIGIGEVSDLFIGYTLTALGVRVLFGSWLDRFDRRRVAVTAAALYALVVLATAALQPGWLFPLGLSLGLAHGAIYPTLSALFIEGSEAQGGALMTYLGGAFNVGMVLSTLGFGLIAGWTGYRPVFLLAGLLVASSVPLLVRLQRASSQGERSLGAPG